MPVQVRTPSYSVFKTKTDQPKANTFSACCCGGWSAVEKGAELCRQRRVRGCSWGCSSSTDVGGRPGAAEELSQAAV